MPQIERLTITLPAQLASDIKDVVAEGEYASTSEIIREALRDWKVKRARQSHEVAVLQADIDKGLADVASGRVMDFDASRVIEQGRKLSKGRSRSV